jgi:hypothetical protein
MSKTDTKPTGDQVDRAVAILTAYEVKSALRFGDKDTVRAVVRELLERVI